MIREPYSPHDVFEALRRRRWAIAIPLWAAVMATVGYSASLPDRYESDVRIQLVPAGVTERYVPSAVALPLDVRLTAITETVLNGGRLQQIVDELRLYGAEGGRSDTDRLARIRRDFRIRGSSSDSFILTYAGPDAQTASTVAARLGAAFIDENRRRSEVVAGAAADFLDAQLADARNRLEENERQLAEFNRRNAGALPSQLQSNLQMLQNAQNQIQILRDALARDRDEALVLDGLIASAGSNFDQQIESPATEPGGNSKPAEGSPGQLLQAATMELRDLQSRLKPEHPDIARLKRRIAELEAQAKALPVAESPVIAATRVPLTRRDRMLDLRAAREKLDRQIVSRQNEEKRLASQIEDYRQRIDDTPGRETEVTALMRDYDTLKAMYSSLLAKNEEAKVSANLQDDAIGERFVIASPATLPSRPASPNRIQINIVGMIFGLLLGIGVGAFIEYRDTSVRSAQDVSVALGLPLLATIPVIQSASERRWTRPKQVLGWSATTVAAVATAVLLWKLSQ